MPGPNVCILHLSSPLAVHDNGALRLVKLLERAHRVAGRWREATQNSSSLLSAHRFVQLAECRDTGEFTVVEPFLFIDRYGKTVQSLCSPLPPTTVQPRKFRLSSHSLFSPKGSPFASTTSLPTSPTSSGIVQRKIRRSSVAQPSPYSLSPPIQQDELRAFDALLNFLPSGVPDKALLKQAILVTTLSAQYLAVPDRIGVATSKSSARFSLPGPSSYSFASSHPSSASSSVTHSASITTTPATSLSPSPTPSPFSQGLGESTKHLNVDAPKSKSTIKSSFVKRFSWLFGSPSSSATSASTSSAIAGGTSGVPSAHGRVIDTRANVGRDEREHVNAKPQGTPTKPKNAHLVHILPLDWVDWEEQPRKENVRDPQQDKGRSSGSRYRYDGGNSPDHSHASGSRHHHHHDVSGNVPSGSKRGTTRVPAKPKLAQGIEQFLLTFAYPVGSLGLGPGTGESRPGLPSSSRSAQDHGDAKPALTGLAAAAAHAQTRPVPYLLAPGVFGRTLDGGKSDYEHLEERDPQRGLVIGEIILLGALDFDPEEAHDQAAAYKQEKDAYSRYFVEDRGNARAVGGGRAWVGVGDVIFSKGEKRKEREREREERVVVDKEEKNRKEREREERVVVDKEERNRKERLGEREESVVVGKEERDRKLRERERWLEAPIPHKISTNRTTNVSPTTRKTTQSQSPTQLPTPPDSSCSGEGMEEGRPRDRYRTPPPSHQPTRVYASTKEPERERQKDSSRTSRRDISASTSERSRGDKLGPSPKPASTPTSRQPWPSSAEGSVARLTSRSTSNPSVLPQPASNEQPPPRPARNPLRSFSASASEQMYGVEGPATLPSAYYGSSSQIRESRQARTTSSPTPPTARDIPSTRPFAPPSTWKEVPPPVTTRTQHEPKAAKLSRAHSVRHTYGEQQQLPRRPRTAHVSDLMTARGAISQPQPQQPWGRRSRGLSARDDVK